MFSAGFQQSLDRRGHRSPRSFVRRLLAQHGYRDRDRAEVVAVSSQESILSALVHEYSLEGLEPAQKEASWKLFEELAREFVRGEVLLDSRGKGSLQCMSP